MTDTQRLLDAGLTEDEIEEMRELGANVSMDMDVQAARELAQRYLDIDDTDKAIELLDVALSNAVYWEDKIYEVTGKTILYEESTDHWRDSGTGQYVKNPYIDIRVDLSQLEDWLNYQYS